MGDGGLDEHDVIAVELAYDDAWTAGDLVRLTSCFTTDAVIISPYGDLMTGIAQNEEGLRLFMAEPSRWVHPSPIDSVYFVTADVAVVDGQAVLDSDAVPARTDQRLLHRFTEILVNREGAWRISHVRAYRLLT